MQFPVFIENDHSGAILDNDEPRRTVARCTSPEEAATFVEACKLLESLGYRAGYDGKWYKAGDRVELHPGTDLWTRGAKFGEVAAISQTRRDAVRVKLDAMPARLFSGPADRFRKA